MPNYAVLFTYPIGAELSNLYVPGIQSDGASTAKRILTGYALDPVNNLLTEFLPDIASRIHVRIIVVQRILNNIASTNGAVGSRYPIGKSPLPSSPRYPHSMQILAIRFLALRYDLQGAYA